MMPVSDPIGGATLRSLAAAIVLASVPAALAQESDGIIAIDVLLKPDATMVARADAVNAMLRENYPAGYALDATHIPHITMVQRFVRTGDINEIGAAVADVLEADDPTEMKLTATGYAPHVWSGTGFTGIVVEVTPELRDLEEKVVDAVEPFVVAGGTANAFIPNEDGTPINDQTIAYVESFVPDSSGANYAAHVTVGLGEIDFLSKLQAEPFELFSFKPAGAAIYQLGNFGTARKELWSWSP